MISAHASTWDANRRDVGWAILGVTWALVFGAAALFLDDDLAVLCIMVAAAAGLVAVVGLTRVGCRLAFGNR